VLPSLPDLIAVIAGFGTVVGGSYGFAARAPTTHELLLNVALGGTLGGIGGTAIAFLIWVGGTAAGA
jgi:hypothetical protein